MSGFDDPSRRNRPPSIGEQEDQLSLATDGDTIARNVRAIALGQITVAGLGDPRFYLDEAGTLVLKFDEPSIRPFIEAANAED